MPSTSDMLTKATGGITQPSLTTLQCELRALFASRPTNRALAEALHLIGERLGATYVVVHTRLGVHLLSEEWASSLSETNNELRNQVNEALWESVSTEEARCVRPAGDTERAIVTVVMYDSDAEPSGGAAVLLPRCDRLRGVQAMAQLEGVLGYLSLLLDGPKSETRLAERHEIKPHPAADHPVRLAFAIVGELESRYGLDVTAVGFVKGTNVEVAAISGADDLRAANPGVALLRAAMEECLDHGVAITYGGRGATSANDCRLHAQWSRASQDAAVASFPLVAMGEVVAIVSMCQGTGAQLTIDQVQLIAEELSGYAALVPLARHASRSLLVHTLASGRSLLSRFWGRGRTRRLTTLVVGLLTAAWLGFGTMTFTFTVPCTVKATSRRTVSCPRSGVLAELFVRPGERVRQGQVLAAIDANDDYLHRAEISAEIESLSALIDQAHAQRESGMVRIHEARQRSLQAQLVIVDASIEQATIKSPQDGLILSGDLREKLGSRIELGVPLFELARYDRAAVELRIPEKLVLATHDFRTATFAPAAQPDHHYPLDALVVAPSSTIVDGHNVFLAEAAVPIDLGRMPPGMEGIAQIDAGQRRAIWVLTHRLTDWLQLNFWL